MSNVMAVVGGQYGSEGKGVIVAHLADKFDIHVRVGGPNAGHSFYHKGKKWAMQAIPCGWINPNAELYLASGGLIDIETLRKEFAAISAVDRSIIRRLRVSPRIGVITKEHHAVEDGVRGDLHRAIGSTGEGVGASRLARIGRKKYVFAEDVGDEELIEGIKLRELFVEDPVTWLPERVDKGAATLLEGTQGFGLSLIHGPWPYVTSHDTSAGQLVADCGLSPRVVRDILMVVRTFPIRVAGNSGPMVGELTWDEMSKIMGQPTIEHTTVTKKPRRIGRWDEKLVRKAIAVNKPTALACTFLDYLAPGISGRSDLSALAEFEEVQAFIYYLELMSEIPVSYVGTGGPTCSVIER